MTRDMGVVRELLLKMETMPLPPSGFALLSGRTPELAVEGYSPEEIDYHLSLIREAGFIDSPGTQLAGVGVTFRRLSWKGHEFLDTVRNPEVWRETKSGIAKIGGASAELVWEIAKGFVKHLAKEKLGIDVA
jgi:hypothetical protein